MKQLTAIIVLAFAVAPAAIAQESFMDKLARVEANNAAIADRLNTLEAKVDALAAKLERAQTAATKAPLVAGCQCNCPGCPSANCYGSGCPCYPNTGYAQPTAWYPASSPQPATYYYASQPATTYCYPASSYSQPTYPAPPTTYYYSAAPSRSVTRTVTRNCSGGFCGLGLFR